MRSKSVFCIVSVLLFAVIFQAYAHPPCGSEKKAYDDAIAESAKKDAEAVIFNDKVIGLNDKIFWLNLDCAPLNPVACADLKIAKADLILAERDRNTAYDAADAAAEERIKKGRKYSECLATANRNCEICAKHHTKLPADPCRGFLCYCGSLTPRCDCPYREVNPPGCKGSGSS